MIAALSVAIANMLKDESAFAQAEALYSESFRDMRTFTVADDVYPRSELVDYLMTPIYRAEECNRIPDMHQAPDDEDFDDRDVELWAEYQSEPELEIIKPGWTREEAERLVDHLEFVETCNYKGEGEGFELACRVSHLRVFIGKYDYL